MMFLLREEQKIGEGLQLNLLIEIIGSTGGKSYFDLMGVICNLFTISVEPMLQQMYGL